MDVVQIITSVGFPIVACLGCAWFIKYITDQHREELSRLSATHKETIDRLTEKHEKESNSWVEALNNNTLVMQQILDELKRGGRDNGQKED